MSRNVDSHFVDKLLAELGSKAPQSKIQDGGHQNEDGKLTITLKLKDPSSESFVCKCLTASNPLNRNGVKLAIS